MLLELQLLEQSCSARIQRVARQSRLHQQAKQASRPKRRRGICPLSGFACCARPGGGFCSCMLTAALKSLRKNTIIIYFNFRCQQHCRWTFWLGHQIRFTQMLVFRYCIFICIMQWGLDPVFLGNVRLSGSERRKKQNALPQVFFCV